MSTPGGSRWSLVLVGVLVVLLALLATLQYRWVTRLGEAERQRLEAGVRDGAASLCADFDREVARARSTFNLTQPADEAELGPELAARLRRWRAAARWPDLVQGLAVIHRRAPADATLLCFAASSQTLTPCAWSPELLEVRGGLRDPGRVSALAPDLPGLLLPIRMPPAPGGAGWQPPRDHLVVRFDRTVITGTILPQLAADRLGGAGGLAWAVTVTVVGRPDDVIFSAGPPPAAIGGRPIAREPLLALRAPEETAGGEAEAPAARPARRPRLRPPAGPRDEPGRWLLTVRRPESELEGAVASARRRNLALSLGILAMLGATAVLMVASSRRAQRLARQQMDFVAAVSHELRTPLTAIRSAGQNLADGIIDDPERVRGYGLLIEREGRRLSGMIDRVLTFAGIRSGAGHRAEPVALGEVVAGALDDCRWVLDERGFEVDAEIAEDLPAVTGDAAALRQVVANLVDNALKYGAAGRWLGVRVGRLPTREGTEITVAVSDHGPGIPREELRHVFEPFRRGGNASGAIPGSGLGLAVVRRIVEAHGGRVEVSSRPGRGTTFTVRLPATPPSPGAAS